MRGAIRRLVANVLKGPMRVKVLNLQKADLGRLHRLSPISSVFGYDRGTPIRRYYIENFLTGNAADIRGKVLEIGDNTYTRKFGGGRVSCSDVLDVREGNPRATFVADLTSADNIPSDMFDCAVITQTLHVIYDVQSALKELHRIMKPGGVLLATVPGISQISRHDMERWGDYWRFTTLSVQRLFAEAFPGSDVRTKAYGNVLTAVASLHGLAAEELKKEELDYYDPDYEVLIAVRVVKPGVWA